MMLGSQSLGGAFSVGRATLDQMAVRIALQCSEADAQLILSKDNTAARLLNRPGEAIYNDQNGRVEGNYPFQVVWLSDEKRTEYLRLMREKAVGRDDPELLVFEGSEAADLSPQQGPVAADRGPGRRPPGRPADGLARGRRGHQRPDGRHPPAAVVGQRPVHRPARGGGPRPDGGGPRRPGGQAPAGRPRHPDRPGGGPVVQHHRRHPGRRRGSPASLRNAADALGFDRSLVERAELDATMADLLAEMKPPPERRVGRPDPADRPDPRPAPHPGTPQAGGRLRVRPQGGRKRCRPGRRSRPSCGDGPPVGIHFVVWVDSLTNLQRALDRGGLREFALRVLFQMSAADSSNLLDSPVASRLGKNRALYMEEGSERPEKFRPYALPAASWLRKVGDQLAVGAPAEAVAGAV